MCRKYRFKRLFLGIGSALRVAEIVGMRFSAVDGCHMKHVHYRDGVAHLCTTLDGNNKALLLAFALCETESCATWEWFADRCQKFGINASRHCFYLTTSKKFRVCVLAYLMFFLLLLVCKFPEAFKRL